MQDAKPIWLLMQAGLQCIMVCLPVLLFQFSGWLSFCHKRNVERPWCSSALPNIYSFVQSHYWGVGLLRYFKFQQVIVPQESGTVFPLCLGMHTKAIQCPTHLTTGSHCLLLMSSPNPIMSQLCIQACLYITSLLHMQIPNFMLAMPMLYISFAGCYEYCSQDWTRSVQLGLLSTYPSSTLGTKMQFQERKAPKHPHLTTSKALYAQTPKGFHSNGVAPYIHQWAVMTACALFVMNVQVATRYVISSVAHLSKCALYYGAFSLCQEYNH